MPATIADVTTRYAERGAPFDAHVAVMVAHASDKRDRNGGAYQDLSVSDATGALASVKDFNLLHAAAGAPRFCLMRLRVEDFNGHLSALCKAVDPLDGEHSARAFICADWDAIRARQAEFREYTTSLGEPYLALIGELMRECFEDFSCWPAARRHHHNYPGGLLTHTLEVVRYALLLADADDHPYDRDLLVCGCLIHDIGKLDEYAEPPALAMSWGGELAYHPAHGLVRIGIAAGRLGPEAGLTREHLYRLTHLIEQHHGAWRHDKSREPILYEARLLAAADDWSAKRSGTS